MLDWILALLVEYEQYLVWMGVTSAIVFVLSLLLTPYLLGLIPQDYFVGPNPHKLELEHMGHVIAVILRSLLGLVLLLAGIIMLVTPGQGIISIVLGLFLMEFPGKRKLELKLIHHNPTYNALNWLRHKANKPSLNR